MHVFLRKAIIKLRVRGNCLVGDLSILRDGGVKHDLTDVTTNIFFKSVVSRNGVIGIKALFQQSHHRI